MPFLTAWEDVMITKIAIATFVPKGSGHIVHIDRPYHGLVLNESDSEKNYHFSDGTTLYTPPNTLFYLPKGSSYRVENIRAGGCYAINFAAEINCAPFALTFRSTEALFKLFKSSTSFFAARSPFYNPEIRKNLYEIILLIKEEWSRKYRPERFERILAPALRHIHEHLTENSLSVGELAGLCDISEAYFRRLFSDKYGVSPKEYIIEQRLSLAKTLLDSGDFSVAETAELCGYAEPCHFSREFTRHVGLSPRTYKSRG